MILYRNGVISAADVSVYLIVWDLASDAQGQDRHTRSIIDRWPFVQEAIDDHMYHVGAIPGDLARFRIDEDKSVVVVFVMGKAWPEQIDRALRNAKGATVAIGAEYAKGISGGDVEVWG